MAAGSLAACGLALCSLLSSLTLDSLPAWAQRLEFYDGQVWNIVSAKWWARWKNYSGYSPEAEEGDGVAVKIVGAAAPEEDAPAPGRINNADLLDER